MSILYGGLIYWKSNLNNKIFIATENYNVKYEDLKNGLNIEVTDLQNRIFMTKTLIAQDKATLSVLEDIEKKMVPEVYLSSYISNNESKTIELEGVATNYSNLAKQILSFKSSDNFTNVDIGNIAILEDGSVSFAMDIKFK